MKNEVYKGYHDNCYKLINEIKEIHISARQELENKDQNDSVPFDNKDELKKFNELRKEDSNIALKWVYDNQYKNIAIKYFVMSLFIEIVDDMIEFIEMSLQAINLDRKNAAFALLRKPFNDNLAYLEWLIADAEELLILVLNQKTKKYDITIVKRNKKYEFENRIKKVFNIMNASTLKNLRRDFFII